MTVQAKESFLAVTLFVIIWRRVHGDYNKSYVHSGSVNCGFNHYSNGNDCAECPKGTYGISCSGTCPPSSYGRLCSEECNCSSILCHPVYGCNVISTGLDRKTTILWTFTDTTNTMPEKDKDKKDKSAAMGTIFKSIHCEKILVILVGTVSSLTLLLLIGREIFELYRKSETSGNYHVVMVTPVVNIISDDTT